MSEVPPDVLEMGPVDYIVVEYPTHKPDGHAFAELLNLVESGLIRVLDLVFVRKQEDGSVVRLDWHDVADGVPEIEIFEGASSELLGEEDVDEVGAALEAGRGGCHPRLRERVGGPVRGGCAPLRRRARGQRPHPGSGHPRPARNPGVVTCQVSSAA